MYSHQLQTLQICLIALHYSHYRHIDTHPMKYHTTTLNFHHGLRLVQEAQTTSHHLWMFGSQSHHTSYQRMKGLQTSLPTMCSLASCRARLPPRCRRWSLATSRWRRASAPKRTQPVAWNQRERERLELQTHFNTTASQYNANHIAHTAHRAAASAITSDDHTTNQPDLDKSRRPLAHSQLRVVAETDETFHGKSQHNADPLNNTPAPTTASRPPEADHSVEPAASSSPADEVDTASTTPPPESTPTRTQMLPLTALLLSQQEDAPNKVAATSPRSPTGADDGLSILEVPQVTSSARAPDRTVHFDIAEEETIATSSEQAVPHARLISVDDIRNVGPPASVKAKAPHLRVRGVANSSGTFPTNTLDLSQVNPDAIVDPADYFLQLGESLPAMQAANVHIQERIQQIRDNPPQWNKMSHLFPAGGLLNHTSACR